MKTSKDRSSTKSLDGQFIWELENGFELSPRESELLLETVREYYCQDKNCSRGCVNLWVVKLDSSVGKPLDESERSRFGLRSTVVWKTWKHIVALDMKGFVVNGFCV